MNSTKPMNRKIKENVAAKVKKMEMIPDEWMD